MTHPSPHSARGETSGTQGRTPKAWGWCGIVLAERDRVTRDLYVFLAS